MHQTSSSTTMPGTATANPGEQACACAAQGGCAAEKAAAAVPVGKDWMSVPASELAGATPLAKLKAGQTGVVRGGTLDAGDAAYLRAMGVRPSALVRVCRLGHPCIIEVLSGGRECCGMGSCRIGLSRELALQVMVSDVV